MLETVIKRDRDMGTPARESAATVTLTIDGQEITVPEGTSLMRAAAEAFRCFQACLASHTGACTLMPRARSRNACSWVSMPW